MYTLPLKPKSTQHTSEKDSQLPSDDTILSSNTNSNSILVCDNANIHKTAQIRSICNITGIQFMMYLPPDCPELCFAVVQSKLRHTQMPTYSEEPVWDLNDLFNDFITPGFLLTHSVL
ncbi:hypothetical protein VP01_1702g5 [Puccinia sorghi]|uniref:Tc1-like transposase DDE domain-containing protein n=1 Tax=Puccinia sorghi TaxID=27349 RepID=A0A0L6VFM5_9BASI|nr:hypothetical protein VP01_1702g5 [Puccinia sorghi]